MVGSRVEQGRKCHLLRLLRKQSWTSTRTSAWASSGCVNVCSQAVLRCPTPDPSHVLPGLFQVKYANLSTVFECQSEQRSAGLFRGFIWTFACGTRCCVFEAASIMWYVLQCGLLEFVIQPERSEFCLFVVKLGFLAPVVGSDSQSPGVGCRHSGWTAGLLTGTRRMFPRDGWVLIHHWFYCRLSWLCVSAAVRSSIFYFKIWGWSGCNFFSSSITRVGSALRIAKQASHTSP